MHRHVFLSRSNYLVLALLVASCGANLAPVLDVHDAPIVASGGVAPTKPLVRDAILRALASRNWTVSEERPDAIAATVSAGGHQATVLVQYDERTYSITRLDSSSGLKFDGSNIHRRYNHWVDRLRASIAQELTQAAPPPGAAPPATAEAAPAAPPVAAAPAPAPASADEPPAPPPAPATQAPASAQKP